MAFQMVIFDTNILIELYRGNLTVKEDVERIKSEIFYISSITVAEFMVGARDKADLKIIENNSASILRFQLMRISQKSSLTFLEPIP
jgi:predicted nucleic acid-binding protein